jgi:DNA-binding IclR family transcriptional regulator
MQSGQNLGNVMSSQKKASDQEGGSSGDDARHVRAVQRAARIVTALAQHPYPMGIVELAQFVQLSPASVHRLLSTLISVGWVEQNSRTAKYRLGMTVVGMGSVGLVTNPVLHDSRMYLARLAQWSGYDAVLSILVGVKTVQLARAPGVNTEIIEFEPGHPQPAHAMADGKLLLSYKSDDDRRVLYRTEGLRRYTANTITDPDEMEREFAQIREQGYAIDNCERFEKGRGIAVPVFDPEGRPLAAMHCIGKIDRERDLEIVQQMHSLTRELSDRLIAAGDLPDSSNDSAVPRLS